MHGLVGQHLLLDIRIPHSQLLQVLLCLHLCLCQQVTAVLRPSVRLTVPTTPVEPCTLTSLST